MTAEIPVREDERVTVDLLLEEPQDPQLGYLWGMSRPQDPRPWYAVVQLSSTPESLPGGCVECSPRNIYSMPGFYTGKEFTLRRGFKDSIKLKFSGKKQEARPCLAVVQGPHSMFRQDEQDVYGEGLALKLLGNHLSGGKYSLKGKPFWTPKSIHQREKPVQPRKFLTALARVTGAGEDAEFDLQYNEPNFIADFSISEADYTGQVRDAGLLQLAQRDYNMINVRLIREYEKRTQEIAQIGVRFKTAEKMPLESWVLTSNIERAKDEALNATMSSWLQMALRAMFYEAVIPEFEQRHLRVPLFLNFWEDLGEGKSRVLKLPAARIYEVIWGYTAVGKSTLLARSMNKKMDNIGTTEFGELQYGLLDAEGEKWRCVWDLGGQDSMTDEIKSARGLQQLTPIVEKCKVGFVYVFDGYEQKGEYCSSMPAMLERHQICKELFGPAYDACPKVVIKNKCDLPPGRLKLEEDELIRDEIKPLQIYELSAYQSPVVKLREPFQALDKALLGK